MNKVVERLNLLGPTIAKIFKISGTPGASIGVTQRGEVIYKANFGYRDIEAQLVPDDSTVYHIASLTKGFSATAIGILVGEGELEWSTPLAQIMPGFHLKDKATGEKVNSIDVLSHRMGIAGGNGLWSQAGNRNHLPKHELIRTIGSLKQVKEFRDSFLYHNLGFSLIAPVIEHVTGGTYGDFLTTKIFKPLNMSRTSIRAEDTPTENRAKAYAPMDDGTFHQIPFPETADGTIQSSAGGVRSCVKDLLVFYNDILKATDPSHTTKEKPQSLVVHQGAFVTGAHNFVSQDSPLERTYALGFLRTQLPGSLGVVGPNVNLVDMPTIGDKGSPLVIYHQGSYPGYLSVAIMVPQTQTAIVVLTNSLAFNDAADWIGQLLLESVLDVEHPTDFVELASQSRDAYVQDFVKVQSNISTHKDRNAPMKALGSYCGDYYNEIHNFFIRVFERDGGLHMCFQGEDWDIYSLEPYSKDVFSWWEPREEQAKRGRWPIASSEYFMLKFAASSNGDVDQITWAMDGAVPSGEILRKAGSNGLNHLHEAPPS